MSCPFSAPRPRSPCATVAAICPARFSSDVRLPSALYVMRFLAIVYQIPSMYASHGFQKFRRFDIAKIKRLDIPLHRLDAHFGCRCRSQHLRRRRWLLAVAQCNDNGNHRRNQQRRSTDDYYHSFCHLVARFTKPHRKIRMKFTVADPFYRQPPPFPVPWSALFQEAGGRHFAV